MHVSILCTHLCICMNAVCMCVEGNEENTAGERSFGLQFWPKAKNESEMEDGNEDRGKVSKKGR